MKRSDRIRDDFERALRRLEEAVKEAKTELEEDGVIQRFEFTFELFWKYLKAYLFEEGIDCASPKSCFKEAFKMGLVDDEETALRMLEDRNMTAHTYDSSISRAIFDRIAKKYVAFFRSGSDKMLERS